jgi:hypothetical protein
MCPQTPSLSPEYSHKAGLQAVITNMPLQVRPVIQRRPRGARYDGPDHTWALGLNEDAPWEDVATGLRQSAESCEGCPCPLCLRRISGCSEGLERRVTSLPSPQQSTPEIRMHEWYMVASNKYKLEDFTFVVPEDAFWSNDHIDPVRHLFFDDLWSLYHRQRMETNYLTLFCL